MADYFGKSIKESCSVKQKSYRALKSKLLMTAESLYSALKTGRKLLLCGNGGSAADAQHIAAEFVVRLKMERRGYPAIALTTDSSILTACGNDYGFDRIFERQVEALGSFGDCLIAISTSGNSKNVILAIKEAKAKGMAVIGFTGMGGGKMARLCDILIDVRSKNTMRIQEAHITFFHIICDLVEKKLAGEKI
ncbi:MAG: D-sedoheptulose 7-phosphate isomerase [Candidatus Goldiibacteriota bacterium]